MLEREKVLDCVIVGAGHAGLEVGRRAKDKNMESLILEREPNAGAEWARRPPDLGLFTPRSLSSLPGMELMEGHRSGYPTCAEMARYLSTYAERMRLPVRYRCEVTSLERMNDLFVLRIGGRERIVARTVILANGSNQRPIVPAHLSEPLKGKVVQTTARDYWNDLPDARTRILVVGDGASGRHVALDLVRRGYETILSGSGRRLAPAMIVGRSLFGWLTDLGIVFADRSGWIGRRVADLNPVPDRRKLGDDALAGLGVRIRPRLSKTSVGYEDGIPFGRAEFDGGHTARFDCVIWCVGYREHTPWNRIVPEAGPEWYTKGRGRTDVPGLYVTGRVWLNCRASELILGAPRDARRIIDFVTEHLSGARRMGVAVEQTDPSAEIENA